jgi:hypothetical protein
MESKEDSTNGSITDTTEDASYEAKGTITDGLFETGGLVYVSVLDQSTLDVTTNNYPPVRIKDNFGNYDLEVPLASPLVRVSVNGTSHNETNNTMMSNREIYCYNDLSTSNKNVNPLCMITAPRIKQLFNTVGPTFQNFLASEQQATNEFLSFLDVSGVSDVFSSMSLDSTSDANGVYLYGVTAILQDRSEIDQISLITDLGYDLEDNGVIDRADLSTDIQNSLSTVDYFNIKKNVNDKFVEYGSSRKSPPAWKFGDHDNDGIKNVADQDFAFEYSILEEKLKITFGINLDAPNTMKGTGTAYNRFFAFPIVFDEDKDIKRIFTNTTGKYLSIYDNDPSADIWDPAWSVVEKGEAPGTPLVTITGFDGSALNGQILSDNQDTTYDNLPINFAGEFSPYYNVLTGVKYWIVVWDDIIYSPMVGNNGTPYNDHGGRMVCCLNGYWEPSTISDDVRLMFTN